MKTVIVKVPFFVNKNNMQYLLKGYQIDNLDEVYNELLFKNGTDIYEARQISEDTDISNTYTYEEYPNQSDIIKAKAVRFIDEGDTKYLEIELIDSLYYHKLKEPVIKINGYCEIIEDMIHITSVTRITLADKHPKDLFIDR